MTSLHKFLALSWTERFLLAKIFLFLGATRVSLSLLPYRTVYGLVEVLSRIPWKAERTRKVYNDRLVWAVEAVGRRILGDRPCLPQALVVYLFCRRLGYPSVIRIGVARDEQGHLLAHAWVEMNQKVVVGGDLSPMRFTLLREIDAEPVAEPLKAAS